MIKITGNVSKIINTVQTIQTTEKYFLNFVLDERMEANNIRKAEINFDSVRKRNAGSS